MKRFIIIIQIFLLAFTACKKDEKITVGEITKPVLSFSGAASSIVIDASNIDLNLGTFSWTEATFGFSSETPVNMLMFDIDGNNFASAIILASTTDLQATFTNSDINQKLLAMGAIAGSPVNLQFKIKASLSDSLFAVSDIFNLTVTPFEVALEYPKLYVSGDQNSWGFDDANCIYSVKNNGIYEGYLYLTDKIKLSTQPNWDSADAIIGDPDVSGTTGTLQVGNWGGNNIVITQGAGCYKIVANINESTYSLTKVQWALTGDFNSWAMSDMVYNTEADLWELTINITTGGFKFIANQDWNMTLGDDNADGILEKGTDGNNIKITEDGEYTVTLDLSGALYKYKVVK